MELSEKLKGIRRDAMHGGYVATCPALPGVVTEGETLKETLLRGHGAIACRLKSMIDRGLEAPEGEGLLATRM